MHKSAAVARSRRADPTISARSFFAERLKQIMEKRGLTVTEVADRMRLHLPQGESFATSNLSHYRQGRSVPRDGHLRALSLALGVDPAELTMKQSAPIRLDRAPAPSPSDESTSVDESSATSTRPVSAAKLNSASSSVIGMEDLGTNVRLIIDQRVPWEIGLNVLQILKGGTSE
jgi:transcriptional regulator with XRE-family HTH domain